MLRATLKSLLSRKLRLVLSGLAVVLGVMFVSGAFVLTDTLGRSFDSLFADAYSEHRRRRSPRSRRSTSASRGRAGRRRPCRPADGRRRSRRCPASPRPPASSRPTAPG